MPFTTRNKVRVFGGKSYNLKTANDSKADAVKAAKRARELGWLVRTVKGERGWDNYMRRDYGKTITWKGNR